MEKQPNRELRLTKRGKRVRAFLAGVALLGSAYLLGKSDGGNVSTNNVPKIDVTIQPGEDIEQAIDYVNGPLSAPQLNAAVNAVVQENKGNYTVYPGQQLEILDFKARVDDSTAQHSSSNHAVGKVVHNSQTCKPGS